MIDTHLHLDDQKFDGQRDKIIYDLKANGVDFVINNSCDLNSMRASFRLAETYNEIFATVGMHPHTAKDFDDAFAKEMEFFAKHEKVVAVGEIGLDYFYDLSDRQTQRDVFAAQIEIADKLGLPLTLHVRDAYGDAADILNAQKQHLNNGVLWHCYSGSAEFARQMAKKGHYFAFGGAITFKNAKKEEVIREVPINQVLSETDAPYMAPVPLRGTVNNPFNVKFVVEKLADTYNLPFAEMEQRIYDNTLRYFPKLARYLTK